MRHRAASSDARSGIAAISDCARLRSGYYESRSGFIRYYFKGIARYAKTIGTLIDFQDVAFSLSKLYELLFSLRELAFNKRKMHLLLEGVLEDLSQWRKMIFMTQEAKDIHYLDASLLSSCLQIETEFFGKALVEEELDLF